MIKFYQLLILFTITTITCYSQTLVTPSNDANTLAQQLVGNGVIVTNATTNCQTNGTQTASGIFTTTSAEIGITSGIILTSGAVETGFASIGSPSNTFISQGWGTPGDANLNTLAPGGSTNDACILEFDVFVTSDTLSFNYVWASEEYPEYVGAGGQLTNFNDVFGFFISGPGIPGQQNIALVPGTGTPVSIGSVNCQNNSPYYICFENNGACSAAYNCQTAQNVVYDGITTVLQAKAIVTPCQTYHLKLGVQDRGDAGFDSGVFIEAGSLSSYGVFITPTATYVNPINNTPTGVEGCVNAEINMTLSFTPVDTVAVPLTFLGSAEFGVDYIYQNFVNDTVFFLPGQQTQLISIVPVQDFINEPFESIEIVYQPQFCSGSAFDTAVLYISDFMQAGTTPDTIMCLGEPIEIGVNGGTSINYSWTPAAGLSCTDCQLPTANPTITTTYSVTISANTCTATDTLVLQVVQVYADAGQDLNICVGFPDTLSTPNISGVNYEWTPSTGLACSTCALTEVNPAITTTYVVRAFAALCEDFDTIVVNVTTPIVDAGLDTLNICYGDSIQLSTITQNSQTYQWLPTGGLACPTCSSTMASPQTTTEYFITASLGGCSITDSVVLKVTQVLPDAGSDVSICPWFTTNLIASGGATYSWSPTNGLSNPAVADPVASPAQTTTYTVTISSSGFICSAQDSLVVTVHPDASSTLSSDTIICLYTQAFPIANGGLTYSWGPLYNISDPTIQNPVVYPIVPTTYTVIVGDANGCLDTNSVFIDVYPEPYIQTSSTQEIFLGESVSLFVSGGASYIWTPDSTLQFALTASPLSTPTQTTTYTVLVTTDEGCQFTRSVLVSVANETFMLVPNAFSPNGDGHNDGFNFIVRGIFNLKNFQIFDRWGNSVFQTNIADQGWDGTFKGTPAELGVYVYLIEGIDVNGKSLVKYGNVSLLR
jgi:gliding motility-associated-like protein